LLVTLSKAISNVFSESRQEKLAKNPKQFINNCNKKTRIPFCNKVELRSNAGLPRSSYLMMCDKLHDNISYWSRCFYQRTKIGTNNKHYKLFNRFDIQIFWFIIHWSLENETNNKKQYLQKEWVHFTQKYFAEWSNLGKCERTVRRSIDKFVKLGILNKGQFHLDQTNRTNFYSIEFSKLFEILEADVKADTMLETLLKSHEDKVLYIDNKNTQKKENYIKEKKIHPKFLKYHLNELSPFRVRLKKIAKSNKCKNEIHRVYEIFNLKSNGDHQMSLEKMYYLRQDKIENNNNCFVRTSVSSNKPSLIQEIYRDEPEIIKSIRERIKKTLGQPLYLSWFNSMPIEYCPEKKIVKFIAANAFLKHAIENNDFIRCFQRDFQNFPQYLFKDFFIEFNNCATEAKELKETLLSKKARRLMHEKITVLYLSFIDAHLIIDNKHQDVLVIILPKKADRHLKTIILDKKYKIISALKDLKINEIEVRFSK
jgi:hypothetical protein